MVDDRSAMQFRTGPVSTMKFRPKTVLVLAALALHFCGVTISAEAKARQCTSAECTCEKALESNTVEALEKFLRDHQHDASIANTACTTLSVPADAEGQQNLKADYDTSPTQPDMSMQ